jgi:hypothetical protein
MIDGCVYLREGTAPVACIAILNNGEQSAYQISSLSYKDHNFNRALAQQIAFGRLNKKPIPVDLTGAKNFHSCTLRVMAAIAASSTTPRRVRPLAKAYIAENRPVLDEIIEAFGN